MNLTELERTLHFHSLLLAHSFFWMTISSSPLHILIIHFTSSHQLLKSRVFSTKACLQKYVVLCVVSIVQVLKQIILLFQQCFRVMISLDESYIVRPNLAQEIRYHAIIQWYCLILQFNSIFLNHPPFFGPRTQDSHAIMTDTFRILVRNLTFQVDEVQRLEKTIFHWLETLQ